MHDPERAAALSDARKRGGQGKANRARAKKHMIDAALTPAEFQGLIGAVARAVVNETKSPGIAQAIAALARASVAVADASAVHERLHWLEEQAGKVSTE